MRTVFLCCACLTMSLLLTSCEKDDEYGVVFVPTNNAISSQWAGAYDGTARVMPFAGEPAVIEDLILAVNDLGNESIRVSPRIRGLLQTALLDLADDVTLTDFLCTKLVETGRQTCTLTRAGRHITGSIVVYDLNERVEWSITNIDVMKDE